MVNNSLFEGELVRLAPRDPERDAEIESQWTHDPEYLHLTDMGPARPLSPPQVKRRYDVDEREKRHFIFAVRTRVDDTLVGSVALRWVEWAHGIAVLQIGMGKPGDRGRGYGTDALKLILNYGFNELNLFRLNANTFEYNERGIHFLEKAGFVVEVRRRQAIHRDGRRWDSVILGLLREDWEKIR
jgi:RimJ/RimL family protein N-acetyltransferase